MFTLTFDKTDKTAVLEFANLQIYVGMFFIDVWNAKKVKEGRDFVIFSIGN